MTGMVDPADLVVVGGRRDPKHVQVQGLGNLSWTNTLFSFPGGQK